jgi:methionyl-tRNA formyltransferase
MKIAFMAMTQKGYAAVSAVIERLGAKSVGFVVGARDEHLERDFYPELRRLCADHGVRFFDRKERHPPHAGWWFVISWRWLVDVSRCQAIVFHDSLLPRYRGFAPLVSALINGETRIGVTALLAAKEYDRGGILLQKSLAVTYPIKIEAAIARIAVLYGELAVRLAGRLSRGGAPAARRQDESRASYSLWLDEQDYLVDWRRDAASIRRFVDSVGPPYQGAMTLLNGRAARIYDAEEAADVRIENRIPGKVLFVDEGLPTVVCGTGLLQVRRLVDEETRASLLPLARFRSRFG